MGAGQARQRMVVPPDWKAEWQARGSLLPSVLPASTPVLIFGDSWAEDNGEVASGILAGVQGWPVQLARQLGLPVAGNFSRGQSSSSSLPQQLEEAVAVLGNSYAWNRSLVVLHSGGNDFIGAERNYNPFAADNFWIAHCTWGFHRKAREVLANLRSFIQALLCLGCRRFLVSELPFTTAVPALWVARAVGVNRRGEWLHNEMDRMLQDLQRTTVACGAGCAPEIARVPEVEILNTFVGANGGCCCTVQRLFRQDLFHPSHELHGFLAEAVASMLKLEPRRIEAPDELPEHSADKGFTRELLGTLRSRSSTAEPSTPQEVCMTSFS
eukprot:gb/GFBE01054473.1/.p1 GENE.gb/GFBE01054473.1/~~gb/GFBE01054473.1/.p1  ORF type:complete len:326 (+),score=53.15 gb/GFBE01054473.1/:1-978(+)